MPAQFALFSSLLVQTEIVGAYYECVFLHVPLLTASFNISDDLQSLDFLLLLFKKFQML